MFIQVWISLVTSVESLVLVAYFETLVAYLESLWFIVFVHCLSSYLSFYLIIVVVFILRFGCPNLRPCCAIFFCVIVL